jgi:hypothetical protein
MASRGLYRNSPSTPGSNHIEIPFTLNPQGASAPTLGEGDPNGAFITTLTHSATGVLKFTTVDPYPGLVYASADVHLATPAGQWNADIGGAQNANNTWTFTVSIFNGASAADIAAAAGVLFIWLRFRNSNLKP